MWRPPRIKYLFHQIFDLLIFDLADLNADGYFARSNLTMIEQDLNRRYIDAILKSAFPFLLVPVERLQIYLIHLQHAFSCWPVFKETVMCTYLASPSGIPPIGSPSEELMHIVINAALLRTNEHEVRAILALLGSAGAIESRREMALWRAQNTECIKI